MGPLEHREGGGGFPGERHAHASESHKALVLRPALFAVATKRRQESAQVSQARGPRWRLRARCSQLLVAHLSAGVPLDGLLDFAVGASPERLQQLVAVFQVVLVVVFLHARAAPPPAAARRALLGRVAGRWGCGRGRGARVAPRRSARRGLALRGLGTVGPPVGR